MYQSGSSVLGVPFYVAVVGTPDNIANLDAGRNDAAFWRGVIDGTTSQADALTQVGVRPGFGWITGTPHGNEPAGGEASVKELYELAARTDCDNQRRLTNLDVFIQPVTAPDNRDHNVRTTAWSFDPNRDRGTVQMPENKALLESTATYPGLFFIDAHQQTSGYFFPPNQDAALQRDLALRARRDPERHRPGHPAEVQRPDRAVPQLQHLRPLRPGVRRHRPGARHGRRGHDVREGNERELRQAGLRPLPRDGRDRERGRGEQDRADGRLGQAVAGGRRPGSKLQGAGQHAGQPAEHRPVRGRSERHPAEPERRRVRLLLPAEPALG